MKVVIWQGEVPSNTSILLSVRLKSLSYLKKVEEEGENLFVVAELLFTTES